MSWCLKKFLKPRFSWPTKVGYRNAYVFAICLGMAPGAQGTCQKALSKQDIINRLHIGTSWAMIINEIKDCHVDFTVTLDVKKDLQNNYHAPDEAIDALEHAGPLAPPLPPPVGPTPQVEAKPSEKGPSPQQSGQLAQIDGSSNAAPVPGSHQPVKEIPNSTDSQSKNSSRQKPTGLFRTRPPAVVALLTQGENFEKVGNYDDAVAKYREAMRINPDPHDSFIPQFIGMALENKNDLDGAIAAYREAARIDNQGMAYFFHDLIERILAKKGDWQGALREGYIARKLDHKYGFSPDEEKKVLEHINNQESNQ